MNYTTNNPYVPGVTSETYQPDQLIAGKYPIVTGQGSILAAGAAVLKRGTVLGQQLVGAIASAAKAGGNVGNGAIAAISAGPQTKVGVYQVVLTAANAFNVIAPNGVELPPGVVGQAYADAQINFTLNAGGVAFQAGDAFNLTVAAGSGKYVESVATAVDGSQAPSAILADDADPTGGDVGIATYLTGEFNGNKLIYDASWTLAALTAALRPNNIFVRQTVSADPPTLA